MRFYWDTVLEIPRAFTNAALAYYAVGTLLLSTVGYFGIERGAQLVGFWENLSPFWGAVVPVFVIFLWLLAVANFERFEVLKTKVGEYESGGTLREVARAENPGPVSTPEWAPDEIERRDREVVCVVPYKPYDTANAYFSDPAATIEVEDTGDEFAISVSYKVRGKGWTHPISGATLGAQIDTGVQVLAKEGQQVRTLPVDAGYIEAQEDGSWQHEVAGSENLLALPKGVYGLNVLDVADVLLEFNATDVDTYPALKNVPTGVPVDLIPILLISGTIEPCRT